jgi:glycosyltransferase involved in cell wall biosynthesis
MRLAVYTDYVYRRVGGVVHAERAFALFLAALAPRVEQLRLIGRLAAGGGETRYALPIEVELAPLPHYPSLANPVAVIRSLLGSIGHMWAALDDIDVVWVLGPYPHAFVLTLVALARRRTVVLGVRQDWPRYVRLRRPGRPWMHISADVMEWIWRTLARRLPVVAVGPELSARYAHAPAVLDLVISLVPGDAVAAAPPPRDYDSELRALSVGRLDQEKNPLLLAEVLALLRAHDPRWRLVVCGEGDLAQGLADRLNELQVADRADLLGYVPMGAELVELYRDSHALLHVSWTEGFPQVLIEAFAYGLPVVATAVGGVARGVGDGALLIPPGDPQAAADALQRVAADPDLRERLITAGLERARGLTLEAQTERLASFLAAAERIAS